VLTLIADRFGIVPEADACCDTFAHHRARIAILVILSMGPMGRTAVPRIGTRIRPRYGGLSLRRAAMPGVSSTPLLVWIGPGVTQVAQRRSGAFRLGPAVPRLSESNRSAVLIVRALDAAHGDRCGLVSLD